MPGKKQIKTKESSDGQIEMTIDESPLYLSSERLVKAKARVMGAKKEMEDAENEWCDEMKKVKKGKINHKGDVIQFIRGKTTDDHARFCKA